MRSAVYRLVGRIPANWRRSLKRLPGATRLRDRLYGVPRGPDPTAGGLRPVVYLPTWLRWDQMPQRPQFMLEAFARAGHQVWVVDPSLSAPQQVDDRIVLVGSVRAVPGRNVILYTHFAPLVTMVGRFEDAAVVYDLMDDLTIYDDDEVGIPEERRVRHHHSAMVDRADVMAVSNHVLAERHAEERTDLIRVENGVDLSKFSTDGPVADTLQGSRGVVGYHGAIAQWFDFEMMRALATSAPDLSFMLVGPVDPRAESDLVRLAALPNVEHIGEQPGHLIPTFVRGFAVGAIPFVINTMTEGVTPLKMYEYMACGVPVVATPLPACVEHPAVRTGDDPDTLARAIRTSLEMSDIEKQQLVDHARDASWENRIAPLLERLGELGLLRVPSGA